MAEVLYNVLDTSSITLALINDMQLRQHEQVMNYVTNYLPLSNQNDLIFETSGGSNDYSDGIVV